ncbi:MAG: translation initiation factor IF-2 [Sphingobacteriales bacterium]|nr:MAG: translation initiation factor IF-2 [Sphingobacteriales bacterium]
MSETVSTKRLKQVAVEFNVAISTVVDFLGGKGIEVENKPTSKISEEAYEELLKKFSPDKLVKQKAEEKKQLTPLIHRGEKTAQEQRAAETAAQAQAAAVKQAAAAMPAPEPAAAKPMPAPEPIPAPVAEKPKPMPAEPEPVKAAPVVSEVPKAEAPKEAPKAEIPASKPEIETPAAPPVAEFKEDTPEQEIPQQQFKVVGKIDLDAFKPKKKGGKKDSPAQQTHTPAANKPVAAAEHEIQTPIAETPQITETPRAEEKAPVAKVREEEPEEKSIVDRTVELLHQAAAEVDDNDDDYEDDDSEDVVEDTPADTDKPKDEEKKGLTIVGKIDLDQFKPKKKPLASTDDLSTMKKKRRRRKPIGGAPDGPGTQTPRTGTPQPYQQRTGGPGGNNQRPGGGNNQGPNQGGGPGQRRDMPRVTRDRVQNTFQRPGAPGAPAGPPNKEMDEKRIQEEIRKTLNRLTKKTNFSDTKNKIKKRKKEDRRARQFEEDTRTEDKTLQVTEFITANEFANLMNVSVTQVITACMSLGLMISINQRLDAETITVVADEFGFEVEFKEAEMDEPAMEEPDNEARITDRPPIVTIMGHVDHGKTSLLDYIRKSNVIAGESGGITQHIGAYEVTLESGKKITFLDTPGHEAFTAMRARGAKVTDIAIIVIAADDSVMPQTREAISHALAAGVPIVFAFNKIDKDGANPENVKKQLAEMDILVEDWGGKYQSQEISAKKGLHVELLMEKILLEAELLELKADPGKRAVGTVIEASLDKGKGIMASVMVEKGTLRVGDPILAGANFGKVKAMFNERGTKVLAAGPATPVQVLGFEGAPTAGDKFYVTESEAAGKEVATKRKQLLREQGIRTRKHITLDEIGRRLAIGTFKELNLIIKGDVDGSVEALSDSLLRLSTEEVQVNVILKSVGQISESDVTLASASDAIIIGFQVRPSMSARKLAENEQIDIRMYSVIYDAIEEVKAAMEGLLAPSHEEKIVCNVEIRNVFRITKVGTIAGCYVLDGKINRNTRIRIIRDGVVVYTGELDSLKRFKDDVKEVSAGYECGLNIKNFNDIKEGDIIEGFEQIEVARKL